MRRLPLHFSLPSARLPDGVRRRLGQPVVIALGLLIPPVLASAIYVTLLRAEQQARATQQTLELKLKQQLQRLSYLPPPAPSPFPERLPIEAYSVTRAIEHLHEAADAQAVAVTSMSSNVRPATAVTLGRVTIDFTLRGGYGPIKLVLKDLLSRDAQRVVLQQMSLRRSVIRVAQPSNSPLSEVEAQVSVSWLHRPLTAGTPAAPVLPIDDRQVREGSGVSANAVPLPASSPVSAAGTSGLSAKP